MKLITAIAAARGTSRCETMTATFLATVVNDIGHNHHHGPQ